jgi:hypothetical protein
MNSNIVFVFKHSDAKSNKDFLVSSEEFQKENSGFFE